MKKKSLCFKVKLTISVIGQMLFEKKLSLICCYLLFCVTVFAQNKVSDLINDKFPVSPNAASLGIFGAIPVGHYTGTPSISIPIYEIDLDGKKIPINISYHASGIRVNQEASWVGLGWALNAGGMITRQINNGEDFGQDTPRMDGYYYNRSLDSYLNYFHDRDMTPLDFELMPLAQKLSFAEHVQTNDVEPDLYNFNFASYSGVMLTGNIEMAGNSKSIAKGIVRNSKEYLDISYNIKESQWVIYDGMGFVYYFGKKEQTKVFSSPYISNPMDYYITKTEPDRIALLFGSENAPYRTSSWMLDSIKSPKGNKIVFDYITEEILAPISYSEYHSIITGFERVGNTGDSYPHTGKEAHIFSCADIWQTVLTRIKFSEGEILFTTSGRNDIKSRSGKAQKLDKILVKNMYGDVIKSTSFYNSYLGDQRSNYTCRLLLDSIKINNEPSYKFTYNKAELPPKHSLSTDHWGHFNNSSVKFSYSPHYYATPGVFNMETSSNLRFIPGKDKSVNPKTLQNGMLTEIQYPTKGHTKFVYEPNSFTVSDKTTALMEIKSVTSILFALNDEENLTIPNYPERDAPVLFSEHFEIERDSSNAVLNVNTELASFAAQDRTAGLGVRIEKFNGISFEKIPVGANGLKMQKFFASSEHREDYRVVLPLNKGIYRMLLEKDDNLNYFSVSCRLLCESIVSSGGGLRIKEQRDITDKDEVVRHYCYQTPDGKSSGKCITRASFHRYIQRYALYSTSAYDIIKSIESASQMFTPLSYAAQGAPIGYSYVTESIGNNNGRTSYAFHNESDQYLQPHFAFSQIPSISDYKNGLIESKAIYNQEGTLQDSISYVYKLMKTRDLKALKVLSNGQGTLVGNYFNFPLYLGYKQKIESYRLEQEKLYSYYENSLLTKINHYDYDDIYNVKKEERFTDSNGDEICNKFIYSFDNNAIMNTMLKKHHIMEIPIENIALRNGKIISAQKIEYKDTLGMVLPFRLSSLYKKNATLTDYTNHYKTDVEVINFTEKGKEFKKTYSNGQKYIYLWGYNGLYMIAEIQTSSDYRAFDRLLPLDLQQRLQTAVAPSLNDLDLLRLLLVRHLVKTSTYKPLVGPLVRTEPDGKRTKYEYDIWGRLSSIKDHYGNILESFKYAYPNN